MREEGGIIRENLFFGLLDVSSKDISSIDVSSTDVSSTQKHKPDVWDGGGGVRERTERVWGVKIPKFMLVSIRLQLK